MKEEVNDSFKTTFLGKEFESPFFIAASPVASTTCIDPVSGTFDLDQLEKKITFLLNRKLFNIGAVILKTVYYPDEEKTGQPNTRVWKRDENLFNTGHTPREMLSVDELKRFLQKPAINSESNRIIISLGIKSCNISYWNDLFSKLFDNSGLDKYKVIEINARHTLREINMLYLGNREIDEYVINPSAQSIWNSIFEWFTLLNNIGLKKHKNLFIKLPFRSDIIILCAHINTIVQENKKYNWEYGISGVTLINTLKSPVEDKEKRLLCIEKIKLPQLSGRSLSGIRNWAIRVINKKYKDIEISASGGLFSADDIIEAKIFGAKTFQLCSTILINGLEKIQKNNSKSIVYEYIKELRKLNFQKRQKRILDKIGQSNTLLVCRRIKWDKSKCCRCTKCLNTFYCDAFVNKYLIYYKNHIVKINGKTFFIPSKFYPQVNPDYCTGCGLCIDVCSSPKALDYQSYKIILASSSPRRKILLMKLIGPEFIAIPSEIRENEIIRELKSRSKTAYEIAIEIAIKKAEQIANRIAKSEEVDTIIGADTLIVKDDEIIGKPKDANDACSILRKLSNTKHRIITGLAVINKKIEYIYKCCDSAVVKFKALSEDVINKYIASGKWRGKAGGYNIEEIKAEFGAEISEGDEDTVLGLPLQKLEEILYNDNNLRRFLK